MLGGITFAGTGFMVAWLGFPQTRVAAFIPALFWVVERLIQERRARDAALVALPVAALLLGGFPSVAGYALLTAGSYAVVRLACRASRGAAAGDPAGAPASAPAWSRASGWRCSS